MKVVRRDNPYKKWGIVLTVIYAGIAYVLCTFIQRVEGDDIYFYDMAHRLGFFAYLKTRYTTWEGRITSEAMTYITAYFGQSFWEIANAIMLTLLPCGIFCLAIKMLPELPPLKRFYIFIATFIGISLMHMEVVGYSMFWITGSTFYLWSTVAGIWALMPFADLVFCPQGNAGQKQSRSFFYAIPCGFIASMGLEQIAAVVITFGSLAIGWYYKKTKKIAWLHLLLVAIMVAGLILLFISPGTSIRKQSEILTWLPQFLTMSVGHRIFITVQWLLSGFANESKMYFCILWILLSYHLLFEREGFRWENRNLAGKPTKYFGATRVFGIENQNLAGKFIKPFGVLALIFAIVALLPHAGITIFSEMGMGIDDVGLKVTQVAVPADLTGQNKLAMVWWMVAFLLTLCMLWCAIGDLLNKIVAQLILLAALFSSALMFFSPTIYASGNRVLFVTGVLLWILSVWLFGRVKGQVANKWLTLLLAVAGVVNFCSKIPRTLYANIFELI
ncbi:DUF6056 family protein [Lachnospiraceae bacterium ZAX-1]